MALTPYEVGAPQKFSSFREGQLDTILELIESSKRFVVLGAPCGAGKSLVAVVKALLTGSRTAILTRTKILQGQYLDDFRSIGMVDIRGQSSYQCVAAPDYGIDEEIMVDAGVCHAGIACKLREVGCLYYDQLAAARNAELIITNYDMWMNANTYGDGLGEFDLLVCDEGHDAEGAVSGFLTAEIDEWDLELHLGLRFPKCVLISEWRDWGASARDQAKYRMDNLTRRMKDIRQDGQRIDRKLAKELKGIRQLVKSLESLAASDGEWVAEVRDRVLTYAPVWPAQYTEKVLFRNIKKVLLMSATIRPKTMSLLGVGKGLYDFKELPSTFPKKNRPVVYIPTIKLNARTSDAEKRMMVSKIDQIISCRLDRKGIIHTVSYKLRDFIMQHSMYRNLMVKHDRKNVRSVVENFKRAEPPKIIISPSLTTGLDFPGVDAEWSIIAKLPFPDTSSLVLQAKADADPQYVNYLVAQQIVQACGRGSRSESDRFESFLLDDNWVWFRGQNERLFPQWFLDACYTSEAIPAPLPKL